MSSWSRHSELLDAADVPAAALASMAERWAKAGFDDAPMDSLVGPIVRTRSVKEAGWLGRLVGQSSRSVVYGVLLRDHLLIVVDPGQPEGATLLRELRGLEIVDYESTSLFQRAPDHGLTITAGPTGSPERASYFFPLGEEDAAGAFREALRRAVQAAA